MKTTTFLLLFLIIFFESVCYAGGPHFVRADTQVIITVGPFVDVSDGFTPETGVTLSGADEAELIKHGSTSVVSMSAATWAAVTSMDGYYSLTLTTSHTDTEGNMVFAVNDDSVCLPVREQIIVLNAPAFDALYAAAGTDYLPVDISQVGGDAITDNGDGRLEVNVEEISDSAVSATVAGHLDVNVTYWEDDAVPATTDGYPAVNVDEWDDTDVAATVAGYPEVNVTHWEDSAITDADATPDVNTTTIEGGDATDAINTECDNAIVTYELDHLVYAAESDDPADNSIVAKLAASDGDWSGFSEATDSLEAIRDNQAAASDAVLLQNTTITVTDQTHFTLAAGSSDDDAYNNMIVVLTDQTTAEQKSVRTVSDYTGSTRTVTIDSSPDFTIATGDTIDIIAVAPGSTPPTAAQIADAVWDETSTGHTDAGEAGAQLWTDVDAILTDTAAYDTDAEYATAIWNAATASYGGAGTYGQAVEDTVADTNELQGNQNWNVWDDATRSLTELDEDNTTIDLDGSTVGTVTTLTGHTAQTGDNYTRLGAPSGVSIAADIAENQADLNTIIEDTNDIETDLNDGVALTSTTETQIDNIEIKVKRIR